MNREEVFGFIEAYLATSALGEEYTTSNEVEGCELEVQWKGDAFYRLMDFTVTSEMLCIEIACYRNLNGSWYVDYYPEKVGYVRIEYDSLVEEVVSVAVEKLASIVVENLQVRYEETGVTTEINYKDSYLNEGWAVPYSEVRDRAKDEDDVFRKFKMNSEDVD